MFTEVLINTKFGFIFDYQVPNNIKILIGDLVLVPFGQTKKIGIIYKIKEETTIAKEQIKTLEKVFFRIIDEKFFPIIEKIAHYYHVPLGEALFNFIPIAFLKIRTKDDYFAKFIEKLPNASENISFGEKLPLNDEQKFAVSEITKSQNMAKTFLLYGVTGSGKTEVYLQTIEFFLKADPKNQILVLVPEIGLTPQTLSRFQNRFQKENIAIFNSRISENQKMATFLRAALGKVRIVIGTRSSVLIPFQKLSLIIIDEEHDQSFKQQSQFRYSAKAVALITAKKLSLPVLLGSATPSIESYYNATKGKFTLLKLSQRVKNTALPSFNIVDLRKIENRQTGNQKETFSGISPVIIKAINEKIIQNEQVLVFLNQRGFSPKIICQNCGYIHLCANCDTHMIYHKKTHDMRCHYCGKIEPIISTCPQCGSHNFVFLGIGTQKLEEIFFDLFPGKVIRIDRDSTKNKNDFPQILDDILKNKYSVLIGTQMLAKGHHFPKVTMVVILNIDSGLMNNDIHATEYTAQLITQVSGRAGRENKSGQVYIQTYNPDFKILKTILFSPYQKFLDDALTDRQMISLPPFSYQINFLANGKNKDTLVNFLNTCQKISRELLKTQDQIKVFGPIFPSVPKRANLYSAYLCFLSPNRQNLHQHINRIQAKFATLAHQAKIANFAFDIDPIE